MAAQPNGNRLSGDQLPWDLFPSLGRYDVVVCGGGPSGAVAAIAAARAGARPLIVERYGFLGGALTSQGVHPMMTFHAGDELVVRGIPDELVQRLVQAGHSPGHIADSIGYASSVTPFSAEGLKMVLEEMVTEAGGEILYHAMLADAEVDEGRIRRLLLCTKAGLQTIEAQVFVDATGDGDLLERAGVGFSRGRSEDGATQPMTANFRVGNVDIERVRQYMTEHPEEFYSGTNPDAVAGAPRLSVSGFYEHVRRAREVGEFPSNRKGILFFETNTPGEVNVNSTHIFGKDAAQPRLFSEAEVEGRAQAMEVFTFMKKWIPGFEEAVHLGTGVQIGVRESRRLQGVYTLTEDDLLEGRVFGDAVAMAGYPVDIHPPTPKDARPDGQAPPRRELARGDTYQIPYRILISPDCPNLLATGRCVSADHRALGAIRVTPIAMAMGQAAGTAAAMAASASCAVGEVDVDRLRGLLREAGVRLP